MIAETVRAQQPQRSQLEALLHWICGHPREFSVDHQVLNWLFFAVVLLDGLGGIENTLMGLTPTWPMFAASAAFAVAYYLTRVRRRLVTQLGVMSLGVDLTMFAIGWYTNGGVAGSTPLFMLLMVGFLTIFRRAAARALAMVLWLGEFGLLTALQIADPASVTYYPTARIGYIDMAFSVSIVALFLIGYIAILSYNLERRRRQADQLLLNILPRSIAEQLEYAPDRIVAEHVPSASVLFADLAGFTPLSAGMAAADVVQLLNEVFSAFDHLVEQRGLEKIKTIGDCYMVAAGVPEPRADHASILVDLALAMQDCVAGRLFMGNDLRFRIGISSGPLVAGVIGRKKFIYDLWGDTVNTASRMESHGIGGRIQVTESTHSLIRSAFCCEPRGMIPVKGKGDMPTWFVLSRNPA